MENLSNQTQDTSNLSDNIETVNQSLAKIFTDDIKKARNKQSSELCLDHLMLAEIKARANPFYADNVKPMIDNFSSKFKGYFS